MLKQGNKKVIINMSSDAGCLTQNASFIHDNQSSDAGMALSYRTSKVAVNMGELRLFKSTLPFPAMQPAILLQQSVTLCTCVARGSLHVTVPQVCHAQRL